MVIRWRSSIFYAVVLVAALAHSHEGHRPLPTRGMEIDAVSGTMLLTHPAREALGVQTVEVISQSWTPSHHAYGSIVPPWDRHAVIAPPLAGRIVKLNVSPGESVTAGQVLAKLESPELEQLVLELRAAKVDLLLSTKLVESLSEASLRGAVPGSRLVEANTGLAQASAAVELARAKWRSLQLPDAKLQEILRSPQQNHQQLLELRSPIDGVVTHADLSIGKVVDPKEHLFEILDLSTVWLAVKVLEKDLAKTSVGQPLSLRLTSHPDHEFRGTIDVVDAFLDPETHLGTVWATFNNLPQAEVKLLPGMSGTVELFAAAVGETLVVPFRSVIRDGAERFVLVEKEQTDAASTYLKQPLVLGRRSGELIEVRGGELYPGDRVVTQGSHELGSFYSQGVLVVSPESARDIGLHTAAVSVRSIAQTLTIDGVADIPPTLRSIASAQLGGSIHRILVDRGQQVKRDEVLAEITSQEFQNLQLELLRVELNRQMKQTVVDHLRAASDAIAKRQLWENESSLNRFTSRRDIVIQQLQTAGITESQIADLISTRTLIATLPVRAAIDGVIVGFDKFLGHVVRPDEPIFEVHDPTHVWVQGFISERDFPRIRIGQQVRVRFVTAPEEVILGTIARSGEVISRDDRTLSVWIELREMPNFQLQHNMLARVSIETGEVIDGLAVPSDAVVSEGSRSYVFVEGNDNTFDRRLVKIGWSNDLRIAIVDGLKPGEVIAIGGATALQSGYAALK